MTAVIRTGYSAAVLRHWEKAAVTPEQALRLLALALVCEGKSRAEAAQVTRMDRQTSCDRVYWFNALDPEGLIDRPPPGQSRRLSEAQLAELKAKLEAGPDPLVDGVVRWRLKDLCEWVRGRFAIEYR